MILVTGANGHFGRTTIDFLIAKGITPAAIFGLVRDESKASALKERGVGVRHGDYGAYDSLVAAFRGIDTLLFISGTDLASRSQLQENVVLAAKEAGVAHILYTSFERKNETETSPIWAIAGSHLHTERLIRDSGMTYTILRNNVYADYIPVFLGEKVAETGVFFPAGETKTAFALRSDMAEAAANIIVSGVHENWEYYISNTDAVSFGEIAAFISEATGKNVPYINPDVSTYRKTLLDAKVPEMYVDVFAGFAQAIQQGEFIPGRSDLEKLLGRKPGSVKEYLASVFG